MPAAEVSRPRAEAGDDQALAEILAIARDGRAYERLTELADGIGPRLSGSAALDEAITWAQEVFEEDGIAVRT